MSRMRRDPSSGRSATADREIVISRTIGAPRELVFEHGEHRDDPNAFESVLTFTADGDVTTIEMLTVFPTKELRDEAIEKHGAIEGGRQTLDNLAAYVTDAVQKGVEG